MNRISGFSSIFKFIICIWLLSGCSSITRTYKIAKDGVIDLRNWNFTKNEIVLLAGDWDFYWNQLILPADFKAIDHDTIVNHYPARWNGDKYLNQVVNSYGYATFRLKVLLGKQHPDLAVNLPAQATAYRLFVNGKEIGSAGVVSTNRKSSVPAYKISSSLINTDTSELEFVYQISNFHHFEGGMWQSLHLGMQECIRYEYETWLLTDIFFIGSILIMALYHLGVYLVRRKMKSALYFSIICFLVATRVFITPNHYENYFFGTNWHVSTFLEIFTFIAAIPIFYLYTNTLFGSLFKKAINYIVLIIFALQTLFLFIVPPAIYLQAVTYFKFIAAIEIVYFIYILILALFKKLEGSTIFFIGVLILALVTFHDMAVGSKFLLTDYSIQYGLFVFIFSQAYMLSKLFSQGFTQAEQLTDELLHINNNLENLVTIRTAEVNSAYLKLQEMDKFKEGMMGMIVHDLKNPLSLILNIPEIYPIEKKMEIVTKTGKQMKSLVSNILDVQKYENTSIVLDKSELNLQTLVNSAIDEVQILCLEKNLTIVADIPNEVLVYCDEELIIRVLTNLLTNAIKFSPFNSKIEVFTRGTAENKVQIAVKDYGVGISDEKQAVIFEKFGQVIAKKSGKFQSTGLGLTFCKMVVEAHGGNIGIESKKNEGATFWFTLDIVQSKADTATTNSLTQTADIIELTTSEKEFIKPYIENIQPDDMYRVIAVRKKINLIPEQSLNLVQWKEQLLKAVSTQNIELFTDFIRVAQVY